jgi:hypothetical protein
MDSMHPTGAKKSSKNAFMVAALLSAVAFMLYQNIND